MKRHTPKPSVKAMTPASRRSLLAAIDPVALVGLLDDRHSDNKPSAYEQLYDNAVKTAVSQHGKEAIAFAKILDDVQSAVGIKDAIRIAGFVQGFEICRQLMLGDLHLEQLRGGAR